MIVKVSNKGYKVKPDTKMMAWEVTPSLKNSKGVNITIPSLANYIEKGFSVVLAEFNEVGNIDKSNIKQIELIAMDIDSKENPINMLDMKSLVFNKIGIIPCIEYRTFSDTNFTKFRLIYKLEQPITYEVYEELYKALKWKLGKYIDTQTSNPNRIWAGTNKTVQINYDSVDFGFSKIVKLINSYRKAEERKKEKKKVEFKKATIGNNSDLHGKYIRKEYKQEVSDMLREYIELKEYIEKHFGGDFKPTSKGYKSRCCLPHHTGDRSGENLTITGKTYRCWSCCGGGDLYSVARMVCNTEDFSLLSFELAKEYNVVIDEKMLGVLRNE